MVGFTPPPCDAGVIRATPAFSAALTPQRKRLTLAATILGSSMAFIDGSVTAAAGPVLGGWLVDQVSWRAIFLLNVPLAFAAAGLAMLFACESRDDKAKRLDWMGAITVAIGLAAITWALSAFPASGFHDKTVLAALGVG